MRKLRRLPAGFAGNALQMSAACSSNIQQSPALQHARKRWPLLFGTIFRRQLRMAQPQWRGWFCLSICCFLIFQYIFVWTQTKTFSSTSCNFMPTTLVTMDFLVRSCKGIDPETRSLTSMSFSHLWTPCEAANALSSRNRLLCSAVCNWDCKCSIVPNCQQEI